MKNFKSFITEQSNTIAFVFGRFQPGTVGHEKLFEKLKSVAGNNPYRIYASHSQDAKKNPLSYDSKIKFLRKMFPRHARNIIADPSAKTVIHIATALYEQGYNRIIMVAGSDRVAEFETLLKKYNGTQARHGFYQFESIEIVSAGERDPDSEGVTGMSASKLRAAAADNNLKLFASGLPAGFKEVQQLFNELRRSMGLTEESTHLSVKLEPISETREAYVSGNLFKEGDEVIITKTDQIATVTYLGANYIIVEDSDGVKSRKWLNDVELVESKDISRITNVGSTDWGNDDMLIVTGRDIQKLQADLKKNGYNKDSSKRMPGTTETHIIYKARGKPDIYMSYDGQNDTVYISYDREIFESASPCWDGYVQLGTKKKNGKEVPNCVPKEEKLKRIKKKSEKVMSESNKRFKTIIRKEKTNVS